MGHALFHILCIMAHQPASLCMFSLYFIILGEQCLLYIMLLILPMSYAVHVYYCGLQSLIKYISELGIPGAILIFLPGWNVIFALSRHFGQHPVIGKTCLVS